MAGPLVAVAATNPPAVVVMVAMAPPRWRRRRRSYGANTFKLHRLPSPRAGQVLGLVGTNGIGKSTALKILAGKLKPNLGKFESPPEWAEILTYFRGSELQNYFTKILVTAPRLTSSQRYCFPAAPFHYCFCIA